MGGGDASSQDCTNRKLSIFPAGWKLSICLEVGSEAHVNNLMSDHSMRCSAFRFSHVCLSEFLWRLSSPYSNMVKTFARFSTFARGRIVGKAEEGAKEADIRRTVKKTDGRRGSLRAIRTIIQHARKNPDYEGANSSAGGRPRKLTHLEEPRPHRGRIEAA